MARKPRRADRRPRARSTAPTGLRDDVHLLRVQELVLLADGVSAVHPRLLPALAVGAGAVEHLLRPLEGEAVVDDAAGGERRVHARDHGKRRDGREARRPGAGHEELADPRVRNARHADLVVLHPGLRRDGLDEVVAVQHLERLEEVVGASRAARAAHVHAHGREPQDAADEAARVIGRVAEHRELAAEAREVDALELERSAGLRGRVARVVDQRRIGAVLGRAGELHVDGELRAVARGDVTEAGLQDLRGVELPRREAGLRRRHRERLRDLGRRPGRDHAVASASFHLAEDQAALLVRHALGLLPAIAVPELQRLLRQGVGHHHLLDASARLEARRRGYLEARRDLDRDEEEDPVAERAARAGPAGRSVSRPDNRQGPRRSLPHRADCRRDSGGAARRAEPRAGP